MSTTRRTVLVHGSIIGLGVIAANVSGLTALAQGTPPQRISLQGLAWNDPIVATYRDAVGLMKAMPDQQMFSWVNLATIHGSDPMTDHYCPHGDWYFLPWHRAFVTMYERIIRHLTSNDAFAMPFWDWTSDPLMPEVFLDKTTPDGKTNALFVSEPGWERTWPRDQPMPDEIVGQKVLDAILGSPNFEQFGTTRNPDQNSLDASWVPLGGGDQGTLEGTAHNQVHNNIGGWMPSMLSPRDPIFFMHHSNIDRIWALWNLHNVNSPDPLWTDMQFTNNYYNVDGSFWSPKVSDLYSPEALGYSYALPAQIASASLAPTVESFNAKLRTLNAAPDLRKVGGGIKTMVVANDATATAEAPLALSVSVGPGAVDAIRKRTTPMAGLHANAFPGVRAAAARGVHVLAVLRDVKVTDPQTTMFRIFVNKDGLDATTPISDPHYVGTFGVFHHMMEGRGMAPSFALDLTDALARTRGSLTSGTIRVQLLPVSAAGVVGKVGTASPAQLEVAVVSV